MNKVPNTERHLLKCIDFGNLTNEKLTLLLILTFFHKTTFSQTTYSRSEVIKKAKSYLKNAVGEELFAYFKLDLHSYYEYKTKSGKSKWKNINKRKRTKGDFVNGKSIRFILDHSEFPYLYINKSISVPLTSELKLETEINLKKIPDFLLKGKKSDWLTDKQLDSIISNQSLKKGISSIVKRLEFDFKSNKYYWIVFNTLHKEKCYSDEEILHIEPRSGLILKHGEERLYILDCY